MSVKIGDTEVAGFGGGGSIDAIDDITITKNNDDEIQAVATVNQNTATGATNPIYDWVGTLAEYQAQNIETLHPDWICYITDDVSGGDSVYTKAQVDALLAAQAENNPGFCSYNTNTRIQVTTTAQTATKNGWLIGSLWFSGSNVYFAIDVDGIEIIHSPWATNNAWGVLNASIPLKAGQTYRYYGNGTMEQNHLYFYPNE